MRNLRALDELHGLGASVLAAGNVPVFDPGRLTVDVVARMVRADSEAVG